MNGMTLMDVPEMRPPTQASGIVSDLRYESLVLFLIKPKRKLSRAGSALSFVLNVHLEG